MKLIEQLPHLAISSDEEILDSFSSTYMKELMPELTEYYNARLPMSRVLALRGIYLPQGSEQQQIRCPLPMHGEDFHPSCRYYYRDRVLRIYYGRVNEYLASLETNKSE